MVTGAASGIGRAMAARFAAEGMRVVAADVEEPPLHDTVQAIRADGGEAVAVACDVSSWPSVAALRDTAVSTYGPADVVCNNAGVGAGSVSVAETSLLTWEWCLSVNLWGVIHGCRAFLPAMIERGSGHVVNTASVLGLIASAGTVAYTVSKHAVVALSEVLHAEMASAGTGVGVTCLCPGFVDTNILDSERNRPERFQDPGPARHGWDDETRAAIRELFSQTMAPAEVAAQTVEAVRSERFYLLTDADFDDDIAERHLRIRTRQDPVSESPFVARLLD